MTRFGLVDETHRYVDEKSSPAAKKFYAAVRKIDAKLEADQQKLRDERDAEINPVQKKYRDVSRAARNKYDKQTAKFAKQRNATVQPFEEKYRSVQRAAEVSFKHRNRKAQDAARKARKAALEAFVKARGPKVG